MAREGDAECPVCTENSIHRKIGQIWQASVTNYAPPSDPESRNRSFWDGRHPAEFPLFLGESTFRYTHRHFCAFFSTVWPLEWPRREFFANFSNYLLKHVLRARTGAPRTPQGFEITRGKIVAESSLSNNETGWWRTQSPANLPPRNSHLNGKIMGIFSFLLVTVLLGPK